jgi:hypothetical protein
MAIFSFHMEAVQRSKGQSALAAGAYALGLKIKDERTGLVADYSKRRGVLARSDKPIGWDGDVGSLLVEMEKREARKNSITGRKIVLALPHELSRDRQARLVAAATQVMCNMHQCAGIWALHSADPKGDPRNIHGHIVISTRRVDGGVRLKDKTREIDDMKSGAEIITAWRKGWATLMKDELLRIGIDKKFQHQSHNKLGSKKIPRRHLGPAASAMQRRGKLSYLGSVNAEVAMLNGETIQSQTTTTRRTSESKNTTSARSILRHAAASRAAIQQRGATR